VAASADDLLALLAFARVVEAKSFTAAAAKLGVSKSVVSGRVAGLEERLGTRLLQRTTRRLSLTADGLALYEHAARMAVAADAAAAFGIGTSPEPRGVLRVNAPISFAEAYLAAPIATYLERHAQVRVELLLSDRFVDLVEEGVDVAIRISARLRDSPLVGRKLAEDYTLVVASPAYLARRGTPATPADLIHHDCLRYSLLAASDEWRFRAGGKSFGVPVEARFEAANGGVLREAALAGMGLAVLPSFVVARHLANGTLVQVLREFSFIRIAIHAVYAPAGVVPSSVRAFVDLLAAHFRVPPWSDAASARGCGVPLAATSGGGIPPARRRE
jgi:DNA-binding transcriptional LysR family regulator